MPKRRRVIEERLPARQELDDESPGCDRGFDFFLAKYGFMIGLLYCVVLFLWIGSWSNATELESQVLYTLATMLFIATIAVEVCVHPSE
jgi:hypothetical protein